MEEVNYMVCMRVDELDDPVEGSTTTACVECGDDIWISAESRKLGAMPVCSRCAERLASELMEGGAEIGMPSEGQIAEILQEIGKLPDDMDTFETMKETARLAGEAMQNPDDDWGSMCIMIDYDGMIFPPIPLSQMLRSGVPKDVIAKKLLPACVQAATAKRVILGLSSWTVAGESAQKYDGSASLSEDPDRKEMVVLIDITADGVQQMSYAEIIRDGFSKPKLGEWHDSKETTGYDGLFVESLVPTLQLVRTLQS